MLRRRELLISSAAGTALALFSPTALSLPSQKKVAVFAGHTALPGKEGALSWQGIPERQYNDAVLSHFSNHEGLEYLLVPSAENIRLQRRPASAQNRGAELYLEIHHDSVPQNHRDFLETLPADDPHWQEASGFSLYYSSQNPHAAESLRLAQHLGDQLLRVLRPDSFHARYQGYSLVDPPRGIYQKNLYVIRHAPMPAVLIECGYIINPREERLLSLEGTRRRIAGALHAGVMAYEEDRT